jgi:CBS domain-containing protein
MKVRELMTNRIPRVRVDADLQQAAEIVALSGASDLMVVNEKGQLAGVISAGDILRACLPKIDDILAEGGSLEQAFALVLKMGRELSKQPMAPLMITEPIMLDPDDHVAKVAVTLVQTNIHSLPVVRDRRLLGLVTRATILETVVGRLHSVSLDSGARGT